MNHLLQCAVIELTLLQSKTDQKLEEVRDRWRKSANLPRKQKKKERKHLLTLWDILQYSRTMFNIN